MKIISKTIDFKIPEDTVVTIGKFDGIHKGHALVFDRMLKYRAQGLKSVIFTFDIPVSMLIDGTDSRVLTTNLEKRRIFEKLGADYLVEFPFNEKTASISAEGFIEEFLLERLNMKAIVIGSDLKFGHGGRGTADTLREYAKDHGYEVTVIDKLMHGEHEISSTIIRECIERGDIEAANEMLLHPYFFYGEVVHGRRIGRTLDFPTVNLIPKEDKLLPPNGVYFSVVEYEGTKYNAITNIGRKPTVEGERAAIGIETYIYDFDSLIYGQELTVSLFKFLRPEMRFGSLDELKGQLTKDVAEGEKWHKNHPQIP
ncbi:MAG: bifunctional riboflavin kinase/FAD synthetase [Lachnospiraceae bacterium]|nr:bifunctional riboflavin kinase/FAD synthetase [Lachnospiraceae bacterium]MBR6487184.1 bifunctional riboflavin kinase/FAD synthetase [Lachnospiraceae bacterium]